MLADRWLVGLLLALLLGVVGSYPAMGAGQPGGVRPGDPPARLLAVVGSLLMGVGLLYPLAKRTAPISFARRWWHQGHLLLGALGAAMVMVHVSGRADKAPALVALAVLGLLALGAYGRLLASRLSHTTFSGDPFAFLPADPSRSSPLLSVAERKAALVTDLEPGAGEGSFSLTLRHWVRHPAASARFARLALREERLVARNRVLSGGPIGMLQRNWRLLHLLLVGLAGVGLLAHVVAVLFFAGFVAEGGDPYWWHLRR